ncbi:ABC transporter family substrate-binding protein [Streptomyces sp. 3MP-14]|uniref:ABC transporter family substrate-binding protein n=1 Tax=Streptomyces mimosae TaxID=2586635 RepID=A0A5N6ABK4_9ACTN|nr:MULTISPECIES: ABC transporter substrate-binding protein [Streptomyces]KAB8165150.1 ABC transporter family substrate-binding protein [Streptomyces mimosae]KAB8175782.1 ABC transporter family substrate-binding protein [Streptomyces sp. 3MP-14]
MAGVPARSEQPAATRRPARRPTRARWTAALTVGLLLTPLLAGCGGDGDGDRSVFDDAAQSLATAERAGLREGGRATWAVDALPATLNAYHFETDEVTERIAAATLPMLHTLDGRGRPQLNPDYLRSAEVTATEPRQRVVYTLNPEATWSDGRPLDVADFVSQWKALRGEDRSYWSASAQGYDRIEEIAKGPEKHQVEVTFTRPTAEWRALFSPLYPAEVTGDPDVFNEGSRIELPLFAGPFQVQSIDQEEQSVVLARNERWWGDPALLDELVLTAVERGERGAALRDGSVDIAEVSPSEAARIDAAHTERADGEAADDGETGDGGAAADDGKGEGLGEGELTPPSGPSGPSPALDALHEMAVARLHRTPESEAADKRYAAAVVRADETRERTFATREEALREQLRNFTVHRAYHPSYTQLTLNGSSELLEDEQVRWAVARALDREKLASEVHGPAGLPTAPLGSHLRVVGQHEYEDTSEAAGEPGAPRSTELLDTVGWRLTADGDASAAPADDKATRDGLPTHRPLSLRLPTAQQRAGLLTQAANTLAASGEDASGETGDASGRENEGAVGASEGGDGADAEPSDGANGASGGGSSASAGTEGSPVAWRPAAEETRVTPVGAAAGAVATALGTGTGTGRDGSATASAPDGTVSAAFAASAAGSATAVADTSRSAANAAARPGAEEAEDGEARVRQLAEDAAREADALREATRAPVRAKDGEPLSLRFVMPDGADAEPLREVGQRIAAMLAAVGIGTEISEVPADEYFERHIASGNFDLALYSWPATSYPAVDTRPLFTKPVSIPGGQLLIEQNYARVGTDHIDQLLDRAAGALDEGEYHELLDDADARIWAAAGSLPLFQRPQLVAVHDDLAGVGAFGLATPRFQDIGFRR